MSNPTAAPVRTQPQPVATSQTTRKGQVVPVEHPWQWLKRPDSRPNGWGNGALLVNGTMYLAEASFAHDDDHGSHWLVVDLRKSGGQHHRVVLGPEDSCDCQHAVYRGLVCKHLVCVRAALAQLEEQERAEWSDALDAADPLDAPFAEVLGEMKANVALMDAYLADLAD